MTIQRQIEKIEIRLEVLREDYVSARIKQQSGKMKFITELAKLYKDKVADLKRREEHNQNP